MKGVGCQVSGVRVLNFFSNDKVVGLVGGASTGGSVINRAYFV